jgi:hypothetical protein
MDQSFNPFARANQMVCAPFVVVMSASGGQTLRRTGALIRAQAERIR